MRVAIPSMIQSLAALRVAVGEALQAAVDALAAGDVESAATAQRNWNSAHAAMQVVNHRALMQCSGELGVLIGLAATMPAVAPAFTKGRDALLSYVDTLIAGQIDRPMQLWPAYEAMQRARGVEQPNQSELFFPDLNAGPGDSPAAKPLNGDEMRGARRVLETGLLQWLRKSDIGGLKQIAAAVRRIENSLSSGGARRLWWIARGVLEAAQHGALEADLPLRRFVTQLNLQLGRLMQGSADADAPETLLRDALYLAARAQANPETPLLAEVQRVYGLQGALEIAKIPESGGFSPVAIAQARQHADALQALWSSCAEGKGSFDEFEGRTRALAGACEALGVPSLCALVVQLADTAAQLARPGAKLHDTTALEGASALLLVEQALASEQTPAAEFAPRAQNMAARLKVSIEAPQALSALPPAQLLDAHAQQSQAAQYAALAQAEIARGLREIEQTLDGWFRESSRFGAIMDLDKPFRQVAGALSVLGHADAAALAEQCRAVVARHTQGTVCDESQQRSLAERLAALSSFVDALKHGPAKLVLPSSPEAITPAAEISLENVLPDLDFSVDAAAAQTSAMLPETPHEPAASMAPEKPLIAEARVVPAPVLDVLAPAQDSVALDGVNDADPEMLDIFLEEAEEVLSTIATVTPQSREKPQDQELLTTLRRAFHTLKGSGRMVGLKQLGEAAWVVEQVFNELSTEQRSGTPEVYRIVDRAHMDFTRWIRELRNHQKALANTSQLVVPTVNLKTNEQLPLETEAIPPAAELPTVSDTVVVGQIIVSRALYDIMLPEARQNVSVLEAQYLQLQAGAKIEHEFLRAAHTLSGISGTAGFTVIRALAASLERVLQSAIDQDITPQAEAVSLIGRAVTALVAQIQSIAVPQAPVAHDDLILALDGVQLMRPELSVVVPAVVEPPPTETPVTLEFSVDTIAEPPEVVTVTAVVPAADAVEIPQVPVHDPGAMTASMASAGESGDQERRAYRLKDDIDPRLMQIFLEEATELAPQVGQDLRDWRARPDDKEIPQSLMRLLHTFKGSARMAGAMALGQLTHSMESRIENAQSMAAIPENLLDDLETSFDRIGTLIALLQNAKPVEPGADANRGVVDKAALLTPAMDEMARALQMGTVTSVLTQAIARQGSAATEAAAGLPGAGVQRPLIRVRADLIDRLANQAGEVSIARARVSAELRSARTSLRDLTENVGRLRAQLRELEIQAETQMQSRFSPQPETKGEKFDPLEFDRFTRLQELTRLMAESVNDVSTVQHNLARDLDEGEKALAAQARITRDVQQDLMAIRMVPFSSISDRLFRVVRLSAKDIGKRVTLEINGGHVEVDRGVIERIAAPLEHLLRNAIVHGIELPQQRMEAGKPETSTLRLEVWQEGNEVVLTLADDGAGLNIERIREKAIAQGLMRDNERLTEQQIGNFIFRSGFSTAGEVTAEAGRGVGMDVVQSEITALSGRVGTAFQRGKGTTFTIHLPLTLSVLQAVVMRLGSSYYGVPTMMVEQVQRLKADMLSAALNAQVIEWQGMRYPFHHLAVLLDTLPSAEEEEGASTNGSVVLLRSGAYRAAIQVDDIVGGQEIVIKNIGPQLARVPGVTGAAVLGSGETVLILNPVALSLRHIELASQVSESGEAAPVTPQAVPERQRSVLVVDDSLTVRKITGRLLTREGYIVLVAKDGIEALEKMRDQVPDVMITDVEMPRMDGFDLTRSVRAEASLQSLPIIMITSRTAEKHRQHANELGVDVFLGKPYEESELLGHIAALVKRPETQ